MSLSNNSSLSDLLTGTVDDNTEAVLSYMSSHGLASQNRLDIDRIGRVLTRGENVPDPWSHQGVWCLIGHMRAHSQRETRGARMRWSGADDDITSLLELYTRTSRAVNEINRTHFW